MPRFSKKGQVTLQKEHQEHLQLANTQLIQREQPAKNTNTAPKEHQHSQHQEHLQLANTQLTQRAQPPKNTNTRNTNNTYVRLLWQNVGWWTWWRTEHQHQEHQLPANTQLLQENTALDENTNTKNTSPANIRVLQENVCA